MDEKNSASGFSENIVAPHEIIIEDQDHFLSEFRAYLKKWVHNSPTGPQGDDLEKVVAYFTDLCKVDLEAVFNVLRTFRRLIEKQRIPDWSAAFNSILDAVQGYVTSRCKAPLAIKKIPDS